MPVQLFRATPGSWRRSDQGGDHRRGEYDARAPPTQLNELDVPEWAEVGLDKVEWRKLLQTTRVWGSIGSAGVCSKKNERGAANRQLKLGGKIVKSDASP
jgi:hypothetical protein